MRGAVDVVVPFKGRQEALDALVARLSVLQVHADDTIVVVENTAGSSPVDRTGQRVRVVHNAERQTPGFARNCGAALGSAEWLVFIDADTEPRSDLLDRYFDAAPGERTVLLAGEVIDEPVGIDAPLAARHAYLRGTLSQSRSLGRGFAQTANLACRRSAFEAVGGFREDIRAAEDADLNFRLTGAGGEIERRDAAVVVHHSRRTLGSFLAQAALHGAGAAWLNRTYPGSFPGSRRPGLIWWAIRWSVPECARAIRTRDRDRLVRGLLDPLWELSFEFGRSLPNDRPWRWRR